MSSLSIHHLWHEHFTATAVNYMFTQRPFFADATVGLTSDRILKKYVDSVTSK